MGDPRKHRKKYTGPAHPWQRQRIDEEKILMADYGFKNKTEIWKMTSFLKSLQQQAKNIIASRTNQSELESKQMMIRLSKYGLSSATSKVEHVLNITLKDILERRLQTVVVRKNLARSMSQSRQFITHQHVAVSGKVVTSPSHLVTLEEEASIGFIESSNLFSIDHPERTLVKKEAAPIQEENASKEETKEAA
jgi:small subunit ribosomal protein S4